MSEPPAQEKGATEGKEISIHKRYGLHIMGLWLSNIRLSNCVSFCKGSPSFAQPALNRKQRE